MDCRRTDSRLRISVRKGRGGEGGERVVEGELDMRKVECVGQNLNVYSLAKKNLIIALYMGLLLTIVFEGFDA